LFSVPIAESEMSDRQPTTMRQMQTRTPRMCFEPRSKSFRGREPPKWALPEQLTGSSGLEARERSQEETPTGREAEPSETQRSLISSSLSIPQQSVSSTTGACSATPECAEAASSLSERIMSAAVSRPGDALAILFEAIHPDKQTPARSTSTQISDTEESGRYQHAASCEPSSANKIAAPKLPTINERSITRLSMPDDETLDWWDKSRFVRMGWLTGQEAVTYLDL
jgi:hypothetical protein